MGRVFYTALASAMGYDGTGESAHEHIPFGKGGWPMLCIASLRAYGIRARAAMADNFEDIAPKTQLASLIEQGFGSEFGAVAVRHKTGYYLL